MIQDNKVERTIEVARLYYEGNLKQEDIAQKLSISRPLVSKILNDAKEMGIVTFNINSPTENESELSQKICEKFGLNRCFIADGDDDASIDKEIIRLAIKRVEEKLHTNCNIGIDWGSKISDMIKAINFRIPDNQSGYACSLIGNSPTPNRAYHSNELLRMMCEKIAYTPKFFYAPAFFETHAEKNIFMELESCKSIDGLWKILDCAVINIENHPSVPDFASAMRFGTALADKKAIGRFLGYYYNLNGEIIDGEADYTMQIPIELLKRVKTVLALSSRNTKAEAIVGIARTKCINEIVLSKQIAYEIIKKY